MRISVALCSYNGAAYIREQLHSIGAQTRLPDELVVCDDGSTDATITEVVSFSAIAPFPVRLIVNDVRLGSTANFSKAIGLCTGEIVVLADQDDIWHLHKLACMERRFIAEPEVGALFSDGELIDSDGNLLPGCLWARVGFGLRQQALQAEGELGAFFRGNYVTGATLALRASLKDYLLPIPASWVQDHWIAVIATVVSKLGFIDEKLIRYRCHAGQQLGLNQGCLSRWNKFVKFYPNLYQVAEKMWMEALVRLNQIDAERYQVVIADCNAMAQHMLRRGNLPRERLKRLSFVLREISNGNYTRYSLGLRSILHDLLTH